MIRSRCITWVTEACSDDVIRKCREYARGLKYPFLAWSHSDVYDTRRWMFALPRYVNQRDVNVLVPSDSVFDVITKSGEYRYGDVVDELRSRGFDYEWDAAYPDYPSVIRDLVPSERVDTIASLRAEIASLRAENEQLRATQRADWVDMFSFT